MVTSEPSSLPAQQQLVALADTFSRWLARAALQSTGFTKFDRRFYHQNIRTFVHLGRQFLASGAASDRSNISLVDSHAAHSGLLRLHRKKSTPIHGHGRSAAFSLLLCGQARVDLFSLHEKRGRTAIVVHHHSQIIEAGRGLWIYPHREPSLHRLTGLDDSTLFLDFQFPPIDPRQRALYFVNTIIASDVCLCDVVPEKALSKQATGKNNILNP
jgi:hypothetical protein